MAAAIAEAVRLWGRVDILHYNVGMSLAGGDASPTEITEEAFDRVTAINLRGFVMAVKHALPVMRAQESGVILSISSAAAVESYPYVAYKTTKAAMLAFTEQVANQNAGYGIRCNTILPGLMDTPMAVDTRVRHTGKTARRGGGRARRQGAAAAQDGHRLGRGECGAVPGQRRGRVHHRRGTAGRWRAAGADRLIQKGDVYSGLRSEVNAAPLVPIVFRADLRVRARAHSRDLL